MTVAETSIYIIVGVTCCEMLMGKILVILHYSIAKFSAFLLSIIHLNVHKVAGIKLKFKANDLKLFYFV